MAMKAVDFFTSIVRPTVDEFLVDTGDLRRGLLAAIVLYHTADYWWVREQNNVQRPNLTLRSFNSKMSRV